MERHHELEQLQREWRAPVELLGSTPREVRLSAGGVAIMGLVALFFLGAIASAVLLSREATRQADRTRELRDAGVEVQAVVTRKWRSGGEDSQRRIAYEFRHEDRIIRGSSKAPQRIWARLEAGSPITVRFVPWRPELNHPVDWRQGDLPAWLAPAMAAGLILIAMFLLWVVRRQKQLLTDGRPAPAIVTDHKRGQHGNKSIRYEFAMLHGGIGKGRGGESRKPPAIGSVICIVYDRDNPARNSPYPLSLVRVDR